MVKSSWPSKCLKFEVAGSLIKRKPRKPYSKVKGKNLEDWAYSKKQDKDRKVWKSFINTSV